MELNPHKIEQQFRESAIKFNQLFLASLSVTGENTKYHAAELKIKHLASVIANFKEEHTEWCEAKPDTDHWFFELCDSLYCASTLQAMYRVQAVVNGDEAYLKVPDGTTPNYGDFRRYTRLDVEITKQEAEFLNSVDSGYLLTSVSKEKLTPYFLATALSNDSKFFEIKSAEELRVTFNIAEQEGWELRKTPVPVPDGKEGTYMKYFFCLDGKVKKHKDFGYISKEEALIKINQPKQPLPEEGFPSLTY